MDDHPDRFDDRAPAADYSPFVSDYLLYLLAAASHAASEQFHGQVRECGLKIAEWRVLACLVEQDGQMITRLAQFALYEQSRLTRIIEKMEERGLVSRRPDAADRRRVRVHLTDPGRTVALDLVGKARDHEAALMARLDENARGGLKSSLKALIRHLGADVCGPD